MQGGPFAHQSLQQRRPASPLNMRDQVINKSNMERVQNSVPHSGLNQQQQPFRNSFSPTNNFHRQNQNAFRQSQAQQSVSAFQNPSNLENIENQGLLPFWLDPAYITALVQAQQVKQQQPPQLFVINQSSPPAVSTSCGPTGCVAASGSSSAHTASSTLGTASSMLPQGSFTQQGSGRPPAPGRPTQAPNPTTQRPIASTRPTTQRPVTTVATTPSPPGSGNGGAETGGCFNLP